MGRKKDSELERLEKQNRELKQEVRSLQKQLKKLNKGYRSYLTKEEKIETDAPEPPKIERCAECGKGEVTTRTVINRTWKECNVCDWKTKTKII